MASVGLTRKAASRILLAALAVSVILFYSEISTFVTARSSQHPTLSRVMGQKVSEQLVLDGSAATGDESDSQRSLRIMPLGASITTGYGSTDGNGYRQHLQDHLESDGHAVSFVGPESNGNMSSNHFLAWSGRVISQLFDPARAALPKYQPNLVLVLLGNNDCKWHLEDKAVERMLNLTRLIADLEPAATVLVAQLPPNTVDWVDANIVAFNRDVKVALEEQREEEGNKVFVVDAYSPLSKETDMNDDTHPNDAGFEKIGKVFYDGVREVLRKGWVAEPMEVEGEGVPTEDDANGELKRADD